MFYRVDFGFEGFERVGGGGRDFFLGQDRSRVEVFSDEVDGDAGFFGLGLPRVADRVSALKRRQQRRMHVDDSVSVSSDEVRCQNPHEPGEHH